MAPGAPRVVKPGGYLLLSFRGWNHFARIPTADRSRIERDGFVYADTGRTPGFQELYQTAWHTASYVRRRWGEFFEVIDIVPVAIDGQQDAALCRKRVSMGVRDDKL